MITTLQRTVRSEDFASTCWCPVAAGTCRAPYDLQPASLVRQPRPLDVVEEAVVVVSGSILDDLRSDRGDAAARRLDHLAALVALV